MIRRPTEGWVLLVKTALEKRFWWTEKSGDLTFDALLLLLLTGFLLSWFDVRYLLTDTVVTGGDTASWRGIAHHLATVLLPAGRLTGWDMGNFCGYPNFSFYFIPPFLLPVMVSELTGLSLAVALKWAIMTGIYLTPLFVYIGLRRAQYAHPTPVLGAAAAAVQLFHEMWTMFGGNALSTFTGEFCYMFAFALFPLFFGEYYRTLRTGRGEIRTGLLLGLIGLSHLFVFLPALFLLAAGATLQKRFWTAFRVGAAGFIPMAFWILPLIANRDPYTTPVYTIWQEYTTPAYLLLGIGVLFLGLAPRLSLYQLDHRLRRSIPATFLYLIFSAAGLFSLLVVAGGEFFYKKRFWEAGWIEAFGRADLIPGGLNPWILFAGVGAGVSAGVWGMWKRLSPNRFYLLFGAASAGLVTGFMVYLLAVFIGRSLPGIAVAALVSDSGRWIGAVFSLAAMGLFLFATGAADSPGCLSVVICRLRHDRFFLWLAVVFGCIVTYFSAHFLQVPDIRFLPPLLFALVMILAAETAGPFIESYSAAVRRFAAFTVCYIGILGVMFGAGISDDWFRHNNRGYQAAAAYNDFQSINEYLQKTASEGFINPLNAPRVAYEKCDLYGRYGGDRVFESLPFFSGRQTLEGIHYAGSIAARFHAFLQTAFSRDVKTPNAHILSRIQPRVLSAYFDLYNISHLILRTNIAKKAIAENPDFVEEARFGKLSLYRFSHGSNRWVDIPAVRPVRYTGKRWVDDFYTWFKDPRSLDVSLIPDAYVTDRADRTHLPGITHELTNLHSFRSDRTDRAGAQIDATLTHLGIRFTTNKVGEPHIIKVSCYPNWQVRGANGIYPVSPHLMLVIPRSNEVVLTYGRSVWEIVGWGVTLVGLFFLITHKILMKRFSFRRPPWPDLFDAIGRGWSGWGRKWILVLIGVAAAAISMGGAVYRNRPVRVNVSAQRTYEAGLRAAETKNIDKARDRFTEAISLTREIYENRTRIDHRDVIHILLLRGKCLENLAQGQKAVAAYLEIPERFPYSRYVAEAYVRVGRIYRRHFERSLATGQAMREEEAERRISFLKNALALINRFLSAYEDAIASDPYSRWISYGLADLKSFRTETFNAGAGSLATALPGSDWKRRVRLAERRFFRIFARYRIKSETVTAETVTAGTVTEGEGRLPVTPH